MGNEGYLGERRVMVFEFIRLSGVFGLNSRRRFWKVCKSGANRLAFYRGAACFLGTEGARTAALKVQVGQCLSCCTQIIITG